MSGLMTLPAYLWSSVAPTLLTAVIFLVHGRRQPVCVGCAELRRLKPARRWPWTARRERRRRYASTVGEPGHAVDPATEPVYPDLARETWRNALAAPRPAPLGRDVRLDDAGDYIPRHGHQQLAVRTQLMPIIHAPTQLVPAVRRYTAEFAALTAANWRTDEQPRLLGLLDCEPCVDGHHRECAAKRGASCGCPCLEAYIGEVSRG